MEYDIPSTPIDNGEPLSSEAVPNKRKRKKSLVWEHFTIESVGAGCTRACCKQCKKSFAYITGSKLAGTSHLKRHISLGICPVSRQKNQSIAFTPSSKDISTGNTTDPPKKRYRANTALASIPFDQGRCRHNIAMMVIMHDYPLHMVEHSGFIDFVKTLQPQFKMISFQTLEQDCLAMYLREKESLLNLLDGFAGRVSLTLDIWASNHTRAYLLLTGHFIDEDWNYNHRLLNVVMISSIDSSDTISQAVASCLSDWHLERRLFALTFDQSLLSGTIVGDIGGSLSARNYLMLNGKLLLGNCYARVISRLAQDALVYMGELVWKIREIVKYVKYSDAHEEKFIELKHRLQVPSSKNLIVDDQRKWDTTYHMLVAACELKEVFACFDASDPEFEITVSLEDWRLANTLCVYLRHFFDAATILTGPIYPTANAFFPEVTKIQMELTHASMSQDPFICNLTNPLLEKFDKYWQDCYLVLAIAAVMDPRFKMKFVEFTFSKVFGDNADTWVKKVNEGIHELFVDYMVQALPLTDTFIEERSELNSNSETAEDGYHEGPYLSIGDDEFTDFDIYISDNTESQPTKSELDQYLEESLLPRVQDFDVLGWWRLNKQKYPTLSKMASDVLSIPVSTVDGEAVFDAGLKRVDNYRSSLRPLTLQALVCMKDWLHCRSESPSSTEYPNEAV